MLNISKSITRDFTYAPKFIFLQLDNISSNLPGVATIIFAPALSLSTSSATVVPPTSNTCFKCGILSKNFCKTSFIWTASSLVGLIIIAPISVGFHFSFLFCYTYR